jgi:hypothetical protein
MSETYMLHRVENGVSFTLPAGYKLVEVAQADSYGAWLLLEQKEDEGRGSEGSRLSRTFRVVSVRPRTPLTEG